MSAALTASLKVTRNIARVPAGLTGLAIFGIVVLGSAVGPLVVQDPNHQDYGAILKGPSTAHLLGTDDLGRDVLARVVHGGQVSLLIGLSATAIAIVTGVVIGLLAGYLGRMVDEVLMRIMDALVAFPAIMLALAIATALGTSAIPVTVAIAVVYAPTFARLVRAQTLQVRELDYVVASSLLGASRTRLIMRHVLPNVSAAVIVQGSLVFSFAILSEAGLSFLGLGVQPPTATWGQMLRSGYQYLGIAPWLAVAPGVAIFAAVLALNLLGDALRQALDPRARTTD